MPTTFGFSCRQSNLAFATAAAVAGVSGVRVGLPGAPGATAAIPGFGVPGRTTSPDAIFPTDSGRGEGRKGRRGGNMVGPSGL